MKHIHSSSYDFIIKASFEPVSECAQNGTECELKEIVDEIEFYHSDYMDSKFSKIILSRNEILQLAEKIKEIESNTKTMIYDLNPF